MSETLQGEVLNADGTSVNDIPPEQDPRFEEPPKTPWDFWAKEEVPELAGIELNNIQHCNDRLVIVGHQNTIAVRTEGGSWDVIKVTVKDHDQELAINNICYGAGTYVAVCDCGCIIHSKTLDGMWEIGTFKEKIEHAVQEWYGNAVFSNKQFVVVGQNGTIAISSNGATWTRVESGTTENLHEIVVAKNKFVAVGNKGTIVLSDDGKVWTVLKDAVPLDPYGKEPDLETVFYSAEEDTFIAIGAMNNILTSKDLQTWTSGPFGINNPLYGVDYINGNFVAVGDPGIVTRCDMSDENPDRLWGFCPVPCGECLIGIEGENNKVYAVGTNGTIMTCQTDAPVPEDPDQNM